jgi:hypothetical protein
MNLTIFLLHFLSFFEEGFLIFRLSLLSNLELTFNKINIKNKIFN